MPKVVKLKAIKCKPLVNHDTVRQLRSALRDAQKGNLTGVVIVGTWADGFTSHGRSELDSKYVHSMIGGLAAAQRDLLKQTDKW